MKTYKPIPCDRYSEYEVVILNNEFVSLVWLNDNKMVETRLLPSDLITKNGEEFLLAKTEKNESIFIRLDFIHSIK